MKVIHSVFATLCYSAVAYSNPDPTEVTIRSLIDEYETKVRANTMKIIEAKTEEEKNKYRGTIPSAENYATQVMKIVKDSPDAQGSALGVNWLVTQAANFPEGQIAVQMLGTSHAKSSGIAAAVKALEYHPMTVAEPILQAVRSNNPHLPEKAAATFALGTQYLRVFEATADKKAAETAKAQAISYFQEVTSTYVSETIDGIPLADQAIRTLFELANLSVGCECPEIEGRDVDGSAFKLSEYRGKNVILIFWGGWCHACHGVLPMLNELSAKAKDKSVVILGINTDAPDQARRAYEEYHVNFRNWSDGTTSGPITCIFNLRNFPTLYLLDPSGKIDLKNTSVEAIKIKLGL
jgi:peroxiredoxin